MKQSRTLALTVTTACIASPALAHLDPAAHGSFAAGFTHPLLGLDHVLAMVAVGLWAVSLGGRAFWALPAAFIVAMALGFVLALAGLPLPLVEPIILASVIVLGVVVAMALQLPVTAGAAFVGVVALFHGHAHGTEMGGASAFAYLAGFALATAALHGAGMASGIALTRFAQARTLRLMGGAVAALGAMLVVAQ